MGRKTGTLLILICFIIAAAGCGGSLPFEYRYTSDSTVEIKYQGKTYRLNRFAAKIPAPFEYEFESDGDLDITIQGKTYDIDSPYDVDKPKSKAKKKVKKKTTSTTKKKSTKRK